MKQSVVYAVQADAYGKLDFWYRTSEATIYLFSVTYRKSVHEYFGRGRSVTELYRRKSWRKNRCVCELVETKLKKELQRLA